MNVIHEIWFGSQISRMLNRRELEHLKALALGIWRAGLNAVRPSVFMKEFLDDSWLPAEQTLILASDNRMRLDRNCVVVGAGKAVHDMAKPLYEAFGTHIRRGILSVPFGSGSLAEWCKNTQFEVREGAVDNLPDQAALGTARMIAAEVESMKEGELLIVLISGGGSALLPLPIDGVTLEEKSELTKNLFRSGCTIQEVNTVRQCISKLKGGGLAELAAPAKVLSLILSDVIGDPINFIASGPTVAGCKDYEAAVDLVKSHVEMDLIPAEVLRHLERNLQGSSGNVVPGNFVLNRIIGSNSRALRACADEARALGVEPLIVSSSLRTRALKLAGFCSTLAGAATSTRTYSLAIFAWNPPEGMTYSDVERVEAFLKADIPGPRCMIFGGEVSVQIRGNGVGGRCQETALHFAKMAESSVPERSCVFLSAGTDGIDGPTAAAGAFAFPGMWKRAEAGGLNPLQLLENNDSHTFFRRFQDGAQLLVTGHTGTNVMDITILLFAANSIPTFSLRK